MDITVVGQRRASVPPERGTLHLRVGIESGDKGEALSRTTALVGQLSRRFQSWETAGDSPITWYAVLPVTTSSWRPYSETGAVLPLRHAASAAVRVTFRDFVALAEFGAQFGGVDGISLEHVEWTLTEVTREELTARVSAQAVEHARDRALVLARAAGARDVQPLEIADPGLLSGVGGDRMVGGSQSYGEAVPMSMSAGGTGKDGAQAVDLAPEDVVVQASVHGRFVTI